MRKRLFAVVLAAAPVLAAATVEDQALNLMTQARQDRVTGHSGRAESEYRRALALVEKSDGTESLNLTPALIGLAGLCFDAGRYAEAEAYSKRAAAVVEKTLGPDHPLMATALHDLASVYYVRGQYDRAEPLYRRALEIRRAALGPDHPFVAATLAALAQVERAEGRKTGPALTASAPSVAAAQ